MPTRPKKLSKVKGITGRPKKTPYTSLAAEIIGTQHFPQLSDPLRRRSAKHLYPDTWLTPALIDSLFDPANWKRLPHRFSSWAGGPKGRRKLYVRWVRFTKVKRSTQRSAPLWRPEHNAAQVAAYEAAQAEKLK